MMTLCHSKIPVAVLGATGSVGQKFIELLSAHPWFELVAVAASERSAGQAYGCACEWQMATPLPRNIADMVVASCKPNLPAEIVFSGLDSAVAGSIEEEFAKAGYCVISNARNHRMSLNVPLLIPEVNPEHLALIEKQKFGSGSIITNPNCSVIGLALALKPLDEAFGVDSVAVTTMQAISGAGFASKTTLDIDDNVIPYISGEEQKMETEPLKILGRLTDTGIVPASFKISAQCNRVHVTDGHLECVSVKLKRPATESQIIAAWKEYRSLLDTPMAPIHPLHYFAEEAFPQPKHHRGLEGGMAVSLGRLRRCPLFDFKFVLLAHNTVRGAAGCAILNAELYCKQYRFAAV